LISVIICVKENLVFLDECLNSVLKGQKKIQEVIVIYHESSTTPLGTYRAKYPSIKWLAQFEDGLANARNQGLEASKGNLIAFLDADDVWPENRNENMIIPITNGLSDIVIGNLVKVDSVSGRTIDKDEAFSKQTTRALTPGGMLLKRSVFDQIGEFNSLYKIASDHEWFMRLLQSSINVMITDQIVLVKRIHETNLSHSVELYRNETMYALADCLKTRFKK
jgi:glycosyltransferase involved in cell wall biosynthesis